MLRAFLIAVVLCALPRTAAALDPLPQGDQGIAANYPSDEGLGGDAQVLLFEDFEDYTDVNQLWDTWDNVFQLDLVRFTTVPQDVWAGQQAIELPIAQQDAEIGNGLAKIVSPERDLLFLRYYSKFMAPFDVVGSSHNGSWISSHYEDENGGATPGIPADGTNKFLVAYENWRGDEATASPGHLNVYIYHPEQRDVWGDHFFPTGIVLPNTSLPYDFGPEFVPRTDVIPELDRWYCWEVMVKANTPGQRDGRIAFWLDGVLAADFPNLRLRDVDTLTIDRFGVGFHVHSNPTGPQTKWYDNVVAADSYIGPMYISGSDDTGGDATAGSADGGVSSGPTSSVGADATGGPGDGGPAGASVSDDAAGDTAGGSPGEGDGSAGCGCATSPRGGSLAIIGLALVSAAGCRRRHAAGPERQRRLSASTRPRTGVRAAAIPR